MEVSLPRVVIVKWRGCSSDNRPEQHVEIAARAPKILPL